MKKLILAFMFLATIKSNAQYEKINLKPTTNDLIDSLKKEGVTFSSAYSTKTWLTFKPMPLSFRIDSAYLQLIIAELERHGYTLVKLPKKN